MVGGYGLGSRNERGDLLIDWCRENSMVVANTWFRNHPKRLYTGRSPDDLTRNQYSVIKRIQKFQPSLQDLPTSRL